MYRLPTYILGAIGDPQKLGPLGGPIPLKMAFFHQNFVLFHKSSDFLWFSCTFRSPQLTGTHFGPTRDPLPPVGDPIFINNPIIRPRTLKFDICTYSWKIINSYIRLHWEPQTFGTPRGSHNPQKSLFLQNFMFFHYKFSFNMVFVHF